MKIPDIVYLKTLCVAFLSFHFLKLRNASSSLLFFSLNVNIYNPLFHPCFVATNPTYILLLLLSLVFSLSLFLFPVSAKITHFFQQQIWMVLWYIIKSIIMSEKNKYCCYVYTWLNRTNELNRNPVNDIFFSAPLTMRLKCIAE